MHQPPPKPQRFPVLPPPPSPPPRMPRMPRPVTPVPPASVPAPFSLRVSDSVIPPTDFEPGSDPSLEFFLPVPDEEFSPAEKPTGHRPDIASTWQRVADAHKDLNAINRELLARFAHDLLATQHQHDQAARKPR